MDIASSKRRDNIAEYILYMWQVEDMLRARGLDIERVERDVIAPRGLDADRASELRAWYESLIDMMRREGVTENGHLQMNRNILAELVELHRALLADGRFDSYQRLFYQVLPYIVELRAKGGAEAAGEVETCFTALYGMLMLRLSGREVSAETTAAMTAITRFISTLATYFHKNEREPLFAPD